MKLIPFNFFNDLDRDPLVVKIRGSIEPPIRVGTFISELMRQYRNKLRDHPFIKAAIQVKVEGNPKFADIFDPLPLISKRKRLIVYYHALGKTPSLSNVSISQCLSLFRIRFLFGRYRLLVRETFTA